MVATTQDIKGERPPPKDGGASTRARVMRTAVAVVLCAGIAFLGNRSSLPLAYGVDLVFGSVGVMLAVLLAGPIAAVAAGIAGGLATIAHWAHPYAAMILAAEAVVVVLLYRRGLRNVVLGDLIFWAMIGVPAILLVHRGLLGGGWDTTLLIALKGTINGAFNALLAVLIASGLAMSARARTVLRLRPPELTHIVFAVTLAALLVSGAVPLIDTAAGVRRLQENHLAERLHDQARQIGRQIPDGRPITDERLQRLLDAAGFSRWEGAAVIGPGGRILAQSGRVASVREEGGVLETVLPDMAIWLPADASAAVDRWRQGRYQITNLISGTPGVSVLVIEHAAAPIVERFQAERSDMIYFVADLFLIGLLLAWAASRVITGPLVRLKTAATTLNTKIARGEKPDLPASNIEEYRALTATIEEMAARLSESFQEVTSARADLERQVRARTAELGRFKSTLDQTRDGVFMFDAERFRFFYVNEGAIHHIGYDRPALLGMNAYTINPGMSRASFRDMVAPLIRGEQPWLLFETHHRHRLGRLIPVEMFLQYVPDDPMEEATDARTAGDGDAPQEGPTGRFVAIVRDLSERRRVERMQAEFISTVSHELRTPVTALVGALKLLESGALKQKPEKAEHLVKLANRNGERLHALVNDLLDLEKLSAGKMRFDFQVHALADLVPPAVESARALGAERGISVGLDDAIPDIRLLVDAGRFDQVLGNLLSNAIKFSSTNGRVTLSIAPREGMVRIAVADHGPGIPESFRARIFEKFAQADSSDRRQTGGTGLGLAISRDIVERMGGSIDFETVEDPNDGSDRETGTTFHFDLPVWGGDAMNDDEQTAHLARSEAARTHGPVLLVEPESPLAARITRALDHAGQETIWVTTAVDALAELLRNPEIRAMAFNVDTPDATWPDLLATFSQRQGAYATRLIPFARDPSDENGLMLVTDRFVHWVARPPGNGDLGEIARQRDGAGLTAGARILRATADPSAEQDFLAKLGSLGDVSVVTSLSAARAHLTDGTPDIMILDLSLGRTRGTELLETLRAARPTVGLFLAVGEQDESHVRDTMRAALLAGGREIADLVSALDPNRSAHDKKKGAAE